MGTPGRRITGAHFDQQRYGLSLRAGRARQDAAILADHFAERLEQACLAIEPPRPAVGYQQSGSNNAGPAGCLRQPVIDAGDIPVEPARSGFERIEILGLQPLAITG